MDDQIDSEQEINSNDLLKEFDETTQELKTLHKEIIEKDQIIGYGLAALANTKENYVTLLNDPNKSMEIKPLVSSAYYQVRAIRNEVKSINAELVPPFKLLEGLVLSVSVSNATSGSVVMGIDPFQAPPPDIPAFMLPKKSVVIDILNTLDPALAKSYIEIDQVLFGTEADNVRASMSVLRQTFDHFFNILAPNIKVRRSQYWKPKKVKGKEDIIYRDERIKYAIAVHVKNLSRANTLKADLRNVLKAYKILNKLHKRGELNAKQARQALFSVKRFLEEFSQAID